MNCACTWRARGQQADKPWDDSLLQHIVASYNDQVHSALPKGVTPTDVLDIVDEDAGDPAAAALQQSVKDFQEKQWSKKTRSGGRTSPSRKLPVGTVVRKRAAQPGKYDTQWSVGLFEVAKATTSNARPSPTSCWS